MYKQLFPKLTFFCNVNILFEYKNKDLCIKRKTMKSFKLYAIKNLKCFKNKAIRCLKMLFCFSGIIAKISLS